MNKHLRKDKNSESSNMRTLSNFRPVARIKFWAAKLLKFRGKEMKYSQSEIKAMEEQQRFMEGVDRTHDG